MEESFRAMSLANGPRPVSGTSPPATLTTNVYRVMTEDKMTVVRYTVLIEKLIVTDKNEKIRRPLTRHGGADAIRLMRSRVCKAAIRSVSSSPEFANVTLLYEGYDTLYSNRELADTSTALVREVATSCLTISDDDRRLVLKDVKTLQITLKFERGLTNFDSTIKECDREDPVVTHFYATLMRAGANEDRFILYRGGKLYDWDSKEEIEKGFIRANGIHLGLKLTGHGREELTVAVDVDATEGIFFKDLPLLESACAFFGQSKTQMHNQFGNYWPMCKLERFVRDMVVGSDGDKVITVAGLKWKEEGEGNQRRKTMLMEWSEWCNNEERARKYFGSPIVQEATSRDGKTFDKFESHPLVAMTVLPHSRVPMKKAEAIKKPPIMRPDARCRKINEARRDINLHFDNEKLKGYQTHIAPDPVVVPYRRLNPPVVYGMQRNVLTKLQINQQKHAFNSKNVSFVAPAQIDLLRIVYESGAFAKCEHTAIEFGKQLVQFCESKDMIIAEWTGDSVYDMAALKNEFHQLDKWRRERTRDGRMPRVMLFIMGCSDQHDDIKMLEHEWKVIAQRVEKHTVVKVVSNGNVLTLLNIVKKMNEKCGGTNILVRGPRECAGVFPLYNDKNSPASLVIGADVCHGDPLPRYQELRGVHPEPSMIGLSSNAATPNPQQYTGAYLPTQSRKEGIPSEIMQEQGFKLLGKYIKNHGKLPDNVIYYRDGVARSQYDVVLEEFKAFMAGMREFMNTQESKNKSSGSVSSSSFKPREIVVVCTKEHHLRLFDKSAGTVRNPLPGSIVDQDIISPFYPEFLLVAADVFCGSAKGALTTILRDSDAKGDKDMRKYPAATLEEMQHLTHSLTFLHGITDAPTGLPEPISAAHDLAKRGHNISKAMRQHKFERQREQREQRVDWTVEELARKLCIENTPLDCVKFHA